MTNLPRICLWIALVLALIGTVGNTAWAFASVDSGALFMSYVKAIALDVGMVAVAATLAQRKRAGGSTRWLWVAVACFVGGSMYANYLHGQTHLVTLTANLADLRPVILSALLPLMLFALVEIVAHAPLVRVEPPLSVAPSDPPAHKPVHRARPLRHRPRTLRTATPPPPQSAPHSEVSAPPPAVEVAPIPLPCDTCDRTFGSPNALRAHKRFCAGGTATAERLPISLNGH